MRKLSLAGFLRRRHENLSMVARRPLPPMGQASFHPPGVVRKGAQGLADTKGKGMRERRAVPDDFAEMAKRYNRHELTKHYKVGWKAVVRWCDETGARPAKVRVVPANRKPLPDDFAQVAPTMFRYELKRRYGAKDETIKRWLGEAGVSAREYISPKRRPVPDDFAQVAPRMHKAAIERHYRACPEAVARWLVETGIRPATAKPIAGMRMGTGKPHVVGVSRGKTMFDCAADTLRRERFTVYRSNERGGFDPQGEFWRVGMSVLTCDELLLRAAKYERRAA